MANRIHIVGISGSLRDGSYNTALLKAAAELCPADAEVDIVPIGHLPLYNFDEEQHAPEVVTQFKKIISEADAVLFSSPEYNYSFSGVLKNAIDWASRPKENNSWSGKPAAIMGASTGHIGTARGQHHLRQVLTAINMPTMPQPEIMVPAAKEKFSEHGILSDTVTKEKLSAFMYAFVHWIHTQRD